MRLNEAAKYVNSLPESAEQDKARFIVARNAAAKDPEAATAWLEAIKDEGLRANMESEMKAEWFDPFR